MVGEDGKPVETEKFSSSTDKPLDEVTVTKKGIFDSEGNRIGDAEPEKGLAPE